MKINDLELKSKIKKAIQNNPDFNQKVIAGKVGCSESYLSLFLNGERDGDLSLLIKIAKAIGIEVIEGEGYAINIKAKSSFGLGIKTGAENKNASEQDSTFSHPSSAHKPSDIIENLIDMTREILESGSHWSESLTSDIKSFYKGLITDYGDRRKSDQPDKIPLTGDRRKAVG